MIGDWIRRKGYWTLDWLKGGECKKYYDDIKYKNDNRILNVEQLDSLLKHAVSTTPFYKDFDYANIKSFPVITKNDIKSNWEKMHSKDYMGKPIHYMSTSGSTGTPFTMEWDMHKRKHQLAELIYFNEIIGQKLGQRFSYLRIWTSRNKKSKFEQWEQNLVPLDILHLDDENLEKIRVRLKKKPNINMCMGYASTFENIVRYLKRMGDTPEMFPVKVLITGSEVMTLESKEIIKNVLGCKVIDRYANEENGFIAQTDDMSDIFNVNVASFYVEILKLDSDEPVEQGELGRVVITDLYGSAVPLIRYDTGDLAVCNSVKEGWVTSLKSIQGRRVDLIYDTNGKKLTPHTWSVYMWKFDKLKQYQFVQEDAKSYKLIVNGAKGIYSDSELTEHLRSVLGDDAEIDIEHVDLIPTTAAGKFKKTICNYVPPKEVDGDN